MGGTWWFKVKENFALRYVGPFKISSCNGEVAYQLKLPPQLSDVHDVFHMSQFKKCLRVPEEQLPMEELDLGGDLTYNERPIRILDTAERVTRHKASRCAKFSGVTTRKMKLPRSMKKSSEQITLSYFWACLNLKDEIPSERGRFVTPLFAIIKFWQTRFALGCILNK
jgi:hypothetical protein